jgi:phenol 2-monooxygenase
MAGLMTRYEDSMLVDSQNSNHEFARNVHIGMRFPSAQVIRLSDSMHLEFARVLESDGRWRIVIFAGDIEEPAGKERLENVSRLISFRCLRLIRPSKVTNYLSSAGSPLMRRSSSDVDTNPNIELLLLLAGHQNGIDIYRDIPALYLPIHTKYKMAGTYGATSIRNLF